MSSASVILGSLSLPMVFRPSGPLPRALSSVVYYGPLTWRLRTLRVRKLKLLDFLMACLRSLRTLLFPHFIVQTVRSVA